MQIPEQKISELDYIPARIVEGKEWFVCFYAYNPAKQKLDRKKIKLNRIKNISQRREMGRKMVIKINDQLRRGWNPFIEEEASKSFHKLTDVLDTYMKIQEKEREENSLRSYRSFIKYLKEYLEKKLKEKDMFVYKFTDTVASDLLLHINVEEDVSPRTYNNYLTFYITVFNWMVQNKYKKTNPFTGIKKKSTKKVDKSRAYIPDEIRDKIAKYLLHKNRNYLLAMFLEYYCLMRPKELSYLKIKDINLKTDMITVNGEEAKNDNTSYRTIPPILRNYLLTFKWPENNELFIFSDDKHYDFVPGKKHLDSRKFSKYWAKLRIIFNLDMKFKFYGFKDTGIIDYLESGVSIEDVRDQADHYDISMTGIYARHAKPGGSKQIREKAKQF